MKAAKSMRDAVSLYFYSRACPVNADSDLPLIYVTQRLYKAPCHFLEQTVVSTYS